MSATSNDSLKRIKSDAKALLRQLSKIQYTTKSKQTDNSSTNKINNHNLKLMQRVIAQKIKTAKTPEEVFFALAKMEKEMTRSINLTLRAVNTKKQLSTMSMDLDTCKQINELIKATDLVMAKHVRKVIKKGQQNDPDNPYWDKVSDIANQVGEPNLSLLPADIRNNKTALANVTQAMEISTNLALFAIVKEADSHIGRNYIDSLHTALGKDHTLVAQPGITTIKGECMAVGTAHLKDPFAIVSDEAKVTDTLEDRVDEHVTANNGGGSVLTVPLHLPEKHYENMGGYFAQDHIVDEAISGLMNGGLDIRRDGVSFTPFQVELMHELIHVLHNAQGTNMRHVPLSESEKGQWSSYEEYMTIKGGSITEGGFSIMYGGTVRNTHGGKASHLLFDKESRNDSKTISSMASTHTEPDHDHDETVSFST